MAKQPLYLILSLSLFFSGFGHMAMAQDKVTNTNQNKFRQLGQELPTPNIYRNAAGAPGHNYWQQKADYEMDIRVDDENQRIYGTETITYHNQSPDPLTYLWLQLDQNVRAKDSDKYKTATNTLEEKMTFGEMQRMHTEAAFDGGFKIDYVQDEFKKPLPYTINKTMMRVDLPEALLPGKSVSFSVKWWYNVNDRRILKGRGGMEYFAENDNYLYTIAQFYPRMCVYNEVDGWQNKQFLGRGEFTLSFGDYKVRLTVPSDHIVGSTGELQNVREVLSDTQRKRWEKAKTSSEPVYIVTPAEAKKTEKTKAKDTKTWVFHAENVRDFAFATSRKFMWDAMGVKNGGKTVMAMSYFPKEGNPLWEMYSTRSVAHTLDVYSKYTFDYPYPVAISVHTAKIGMEYPMICFNGRRPEADGTWSDETKYRMISVIIHEVGHNYFPMIVNTDERQWSWMDEGMNSFLQYLAQEEWQRDYPHRRGPATTIIDYMKGDKSNITPIMTNSESILTSQFGNNAYGKPAAAFNILRETILGRELFDFAFREYSQRWMFKQPSPADFFRTMEDASGTDLDWFWRGWFYTTDHVDIGIDDVKWFQLDTGDPDMEKAFAKKQDDSSPKFISKLRNKKSIEKTVVESTPITSDFYNKFDPYEVSILDRKEYEEYLNSLSAEHQQLLKSGMNYYEVKFSNIGGLVMPLLLEFTYTDGTKEMKHIPAEIWRLNSEKISKVFMTKKEIANITLDPHLETADTETSNNYWPPRVVPSRFKLFKEAQEGENLMQRQQKIQELEKTGSGKVKKSSKKGR